MYTAIRGSLALIFLTVIALSSGCAQIQAAAYKSADAAAAYCVNNTASGRVLVREGLEPAYREKDMASVAEKCLKRNSNLLITTEKDAVRLKRLKSLPSEIEIFALRIDSRISSNEEAVVAGLHSIFDS